MAVWCVILAVSDFGALWPYQLSRWAMCIAAIVLTVQVNSNTWRGIITMIVAILFNPIAPVHFRDMWPAVDSLSAVALVIAAPKTGRLYDRERLSRARDFVEKLCIGCFGVVVIFFFAYIAWSFLSGDADKRYAEKIEAQKKSYSAGVP